jgi:multiple sugar transport system permease protein
MSDMAKTSVKPMRRKTTKREKKEWVAAYIFIAPLVIGIFVFYIYPFIQNFWFSFNDVNRFNISTFTGLDNYKTLIKDKELYRTLGNTIKYVIITVPVGICLSILIATLLNAKIRGTSIYRTIYFLPSVTMSVAIALVWKWMYNGEFGILNNILNVFGIEGQNWLSNPKTALYMVMIVGIWMSVGYNMIILLAGMQGISKSYYEAAAIDGAGPVKQFFKITIPMLTPTIFFVMITSIIGGFQVFDTIYMMIAKTSLAYESTQTLVMMFYRYAFDYGQKGYAAAISIVIFAIIMLITIFQFVMQKKWVNYD